MTTRSARCRTVRRTRSRIAFMSLVAVSRPTVSYTAWSIRSRAEVVLRNGSCLMPSELPVTRPTSSPCRMAR
ncbi:hypothetical protein ACFPRL_31250 [Pseudoclavibacter helvolus]